MYIIPPWLTYFITGSSYLLASFTHFAHPSPFPLYWLPPICSLYLWPLFWLFFWLRVGEISHKSEIIWYVSFSAFLVSLSIMSSRSIHNKWQGFSLFMAVIVGCYLVLLFQMYISNPSIIVIIKDRLLPWEHIYFFFKSKYGKLKLQTEHKLKLKFYHVMGPMNPWWFSFFFFF